LNLYSIYFFFRKLKTGFRFVETEDATDDGATDEAETDDAAADEAATDDATDESAIEDRATDVLSSSSSSDD